MFDLQDISFSYDGEHRALDGVSLHISQGEFVCLAGGNGSGKSTLAKHLNGLLLPNEGEVRFRGDQIADAQAANAVRSRVAMVFQNPDDALVETIVENEVAFGPSNLGIDAAQLRDRVTESLRIVGLEGFEKRDVNSLSGGQKQRLALAGALAMNPDALILDEATSMLDPQGRAIVLEIVRSLNNQGMTAVMITHDMDEALHASRLILMEAGAIVADGKPDELLANYRLVSQLGLCQPRSFQLARLLKARGATRPLSELNRICKEDICALFSQA